MYSLSQKTGKIELVWRNDAPARTAKRARLLVVDSEVEFRRQLNRNAREFMVRARAVQAWLAERRRTG